MNTVLWRTTIATLIAFAGAGAGAVVGGGGRARLSVLVNAALGALLAVALLDILPDAKALLSWPKLLAGAASGYLLFWVIGRYIYPICPACSLPADNPRSLLLSRTLILLMLALGIHSTMDGAAVVLGDDVIHRVNIPIFVAISFHKFPEGMALTLLLIGAGYRRRSAFLWTLLIESTTELGALAAVLLIRGISEMWLGLTFANVGGGFLYLVANTFILARGHAGETPDPRAGRVRFAATGIAFAVTGGIIAVSRMVAP